MELANKSTSLFLSLPEDIIVSILARISTSYHPNLCIVSKKIRSLILSKELDMMRSNLKTREKCVYVRLQSCTNLCDSRWFSLWIKPDNHQNLPPYCTIDEYKDTRNWLVPMPSSYSPRFPIFQETIGSETYEIGGQDMTFSTDVWVYNKLNGKRSKAPNMMVARKNALTCSLDGKLYVIGGCEVDESTYWAEAFDPKTQIWEVLPDPGPKLRTYPIKKIEAQRGKIYVRSTQNNFVYNTKQKRWEVVDANLGNSMCEIDNIWYCFTDRVCMWYDTNCENWRLVQGLSDRYIKDGEICNYGGKLVIFWSQVLYPALETSEYLCAVIKLEERNDGEIWGEIEWDDLVLRFPRSYLLVCCTESSQ